MINAHTPHTKAFVNRRRSTKQCNYHACAGG